MAVPSEGHAAAAPSRFASEGEATRLLYERHQRKILSFCKHQLGSREEAEDATQITFLNAFRGMKRGTSPEFESAWLFKIAHNVCLTKQRNSYRRGQIEAPSDFTLIGRVPAHESDTDELFGLPAALRVIPEQQRRALLLREWQGLTYKEIAEEMRLTQAAVETLLFRARRSLADALTKDPADKPKRGRPRTTSNLGSGIAAAKSLLIGGGVKVAAGVATVAATSVATVTRPFATTSWLPSAARTPQTRTRLEGLSQSARCALRRFHMRCGPGACHPGCGNGGVTNPLRHRRRAFRRLQPKHGRPHWSASGSRSVTQRHSRLVTRRSGSRYRRRYPRQYLGTFLRRADPLLRL